MKCVLQSFWAYSCLYLMYDKSAELKAKKKVSDHN